MTQNTTPNPIPKEGIDLPAASLLICSRNRPQLLWETINSILQGNEVPVEMVVIDQSDVANPNLAAFQPEQNCEFRYVWSERTGVSLGRNKAAAIATQPILVFTDDDMLATPDWYGLLVRAAHLAGAQAIVTGQVLASAEEGSGFAPSTRTDNQKVVYEGRINKDVLYTGNMAIYRASFHTVGGFDVRLGPGTPYPAAEDNDFAFRWLETGGRIIYDPRCTLYHRAWRSEREFLRLQWHYGYGQGAFYGKHLSFRDRFILKRLLRDVWAYLSRFPFRLLRRRRQAYENLLFGLGLLVGALRWRLRSPKEPT